MEDSVRKQQINEIISDLGENEEKDYTQIKEYFNNACDDGSLVNNNDIKQRALEKQFVADFESLLSGFKRSYSKMMSCYVFSDPAVVATASTAVETAIQGVLDNNCDVLKAKLVSRDR